MAKIKLLLISVVFLILSMTFVLAIQPSQSFSKIYLQPFYRNTMALNTNYTYSLTINPPDGLSSVLNAIVSFNAQINGQTQTFTLWVNGQSCNNPTYSVATAFSATGNAQFYFDCSNIINKAGTYTITFRSAVNTGAIQSWLELTYMNNPQGEVKLHGTEYNNEQTAKIWLQLLNSSQQAILTAVCYTDIYTPSNGIYLEKATMINMGHDGIYYYNMPVPLIEGVYPVIANCYYTATETPNFPSSVTMYLNSTIDVGDVTRTYVLDTSYLSTSESSVTYGNPRRYESQFKFNNATCNNISSSLLTGITVSWVGRWNSNVVNDVITISVYNYTSSKWMRLPNTITGVGTGVKSVSNSLSFNNITTAGLVNSSGKGLMLKFNDTILADTSTTGLDYDFLTLYCDQLGDPQYQQVKGSSEIHVTRTLEQLPFQVTTLCGNELSACAEFRHDPTYWNYTWGYIFENLTVINIQQSLVDDYYAYQTPLGEDCTAVIDIVESNETDSWSILNDTIFSVGDKDNCKLSLPITFSATDYSKQIVITLDNYMIWEVQRDRDYVNYFELAIEPFCQEIASANNRTYNIPMEVDGEQDVSTLYINQPLFLSCYRALDDLYWFNDYYETSLSITTSGEYEAYLIEARYYYPELKQHTQIVQYLSTDIINRLFDVNTLCGNSVESSCAVGYPPDSYFSSQEGYIVENLTITNLFNSQLTSDYRYTSSEDVDCSAVKDVTEIRNGTEIDIYNDVISSVGLVKNCIMNIPISFEEGESEYVIRIRMGNYVHWNMYQMGDKVKSIRAKTEDFCNDLAIERGVTYQIPINSSIDYFLNDTDLMFCNRAMDDLYWWDFFDAIHLVDTQNHTLAVPMETIEQTYAELKYFYSFIIQNDNVISTFKRNQNQLLTLNMVSDILNNTHLRVWNWTDRTLTQNISVAINNTQVAEAVWSWQGLLDTNVLNQLADAIWSWVGRYINGEII